MKKALAVLILFSLLLPAVVLSEGMKEVDIYGGYAHIEIAKDNTPTMFVIYFAEDYTCYYVAQAFNNRGPSVGRAYVGTWGYTAKGEVHAKIGDNVDATFHITSFGNIVDVETMQVYEYFNGLYH